MVARREEANRSALDGVGPVLGTVNTQEQLDPARALLQVSRSSTVKPDLDRQLTLIQNIQNMLFCPQFAPRQTRETGDAASRNEAQTIVDTEVM